LRVSEPIFKKCVKQDEFWNIVKEGNRIKKRTPKDETDIQGAIIRMISDQLIIAKIFVSPEYDTGMEKTDKLTT
jgi:hypothetical protein